MSSVSVSVTGFTNPISVVLQESHDSLSTLIIESIECPVEIGDEIECYFTSDDTTEKRFKGYVKQIDRKIPDNTYVITANDMFIRAVEYFFAATDPNNPFSRNHIQAETLVGDVLAEAGLTNYVYQTSYFELFTMRTEGIQVNLISANDFVKNIARILAWSVWCDENGIVYFKNRKPYVMTGTSGEYGDISDVPIDYTLTDALMLSGSYGKDDKNLRNKVIVYTEDGSATASASSPYVPSGFYRTTIMGADGIVAQSNAQYVANVNLNLLNRLTEQLSCQVIGNPMLAARKVISVNSTLFNLSGNWYIYTCQHEFSRSGYTNSLILRK